MVAATLTLFESPFGLITIVGNAIAGYKLEAIVKAIYKEQGYKS